jgi:hypothetical protein
MFSEMFPFNLGIKKGFLIGGAKRNAYVAGTVGPTSRIYRHARLDDHENVW